MAPDPLEVGLLELVLEVDPVLPGLVEAEPETRESSPEPTIWPLLAAIAVGATFIGTIFTPWGLVYGTPPVTIALIAWFWPKGATEDEQ